MMIPILNSKKMVCQPPIGRSSNRDPVSETIPKLPEAVGKGKAKVTEEQAAHFLVDLSKKKSTTDQFILVKRVQAPHDSKTGPSSQHEDDTSEKVVQEIFFNKLIQERNKVEPICLCSLKLKNERVKSTSSTVSSGVMIPVQTDDQAGSDAGKRHVRLWLDRP
ncbi:hypothetical protein Tco_0619801 [Tanacetum coccineum]